MTKIRTAICAAITKGERDKDAPSRAGQVDNLPPTGSECSTNLFRFGIEPAGNRLPPTATPARKVGAAQVTPVIGSMMQPYRRRGVHEDLTGETLALPVFDIQLPEGRGLLRKRRFQCLSKSVRSNSAQHLLSASPPQHSPSRSVRRLPAPQPATSRIIEFIAIALLTRPIDGMGVCSPQRYLMGRSTASCPTFLRTRSGDRVIYSCRASGFWVNRATCRRVPAPISIATFGNTFTGVASV